MEDFSKRLREAMEYRNFRQVDLVNTTNIDKGTISNYLSGKYKPKNVNAILIARALNVNELWLMGYDVPMVVDKYVEHSVSDDRKSYMTIEWKEGFEKEITKERWSGFYDEIVKLPEDMQLDIYKYVVLYVNMAIAQENIKKRK